MRNDTFDERQIVERGKAFQIGFFTAILLSLAVFFATGVLDIRIEALTVFILQTSLPIMVCMMALILKNAYDPVKQRNGRILCALFSFLGLYLIVFSVGRVLLGQESFLKDGVVTNNTGFLVIGLAMLDTGLVYLLRRYLDWKEMKEE
jgi:hypothetical protein